MNTYTPLAAALTMVAVGTPLVCQAQDPAAEYKNIISLRSAGKNADALATVDRYLKTFGNPTSRVAKQFAHYTPFFYWQKAEILSSMGELEKAYEAFSDLRNNKIYQDKKLIERSKELPGQAEGYAPLLSAALFQMGYMRYQQAAGKNGQAADISKYEEAIPLLEEYLKYYESGKASKFEQSSGLDGKVCFLLLQSYLLKKEPDFTKAGIYMEKGKKAKAALPDDMVMNGLNTVLSIALKDPKYVAWGEKMVSSNAATLHMSADRMAPHAPNMFNSGMKASKMWEAALKAGDMQQAVDAARTTISLFGLVPDTEEIATALVSVNKIVGGSPRPIPDKAAGVTYDPARNKKLAETYAKLGKDHTEMDGYITLTLANAAAQMGSSRLAKAGFKVLIDRYPTLNQKKDNELVSLRDTNYLQYAMHSRNTGDEATALEYEQKLDPDKVGDGNKAVVVLQRMSRMVKEERWEEVLSSADEAMQVLSGDKTSANYVSAAYCKLAALYRLGRSEDVLKYGSALLSSGMFKTDKLEEAQAKQMQKYEMESMYYIADAALNLGSTKPDMLDKALAQAEEFMAKYPSIRLEENSMAPNIYFAAVRALLARRGHGKAEADKQDMAKALRYLDAMAKNWPEHRLYPTARMYAGNVLINGDDDSVKPEALIAYEDAANAALKQPNGEGKGVAVTSLYSLASYAPEFDREGEDEQAKAARIQSYYDRFWNEADYEGNPYSLQMASIQLSRSLNSKDVALYDKALKHTQEIIAREAAYSYKNQTHDPELEPTINSYVNSYVTGQKQLHNVDLTLDQKTEHLKNFPGILKEDKYTNAIIHMALLTSMREAEVAAKRAGNTEQANELERDIARSFRQMRDQFKPSDLTNNICVHVGNYEVDYARRLPEGSARKQEIETALSFFDQVLERKKDMMREATLGKANALALSDNEAQRKTAYDLYSGLAAATDPSIVGPALMGLTDLNMSTKNYAAAVDSARKFMDVRGGSTPAQRLNMMLKLGQAYCESGDVEKGLQTYMNLYVQNRGNITYSAPACKAMMEQYWKRDNPAKGDRMQGNYKPSDRWLAWNTGKNYIDLLQRSHLVEKMTPSERDLYNEVTVFFAQCDKDPKVQQEDKENKAFQSQLRK